MHKLCKFRYGYLRNYYIKPNFLVSKSCLHALSKTQDPNLSHDYNFISSEIRSPRFSEPRTQLPNLETETNDTNDRSEQSFQISHPWPEWVGLMELLSKRGYFEALGNPLSDPQLAMKESNCIRTACLNFARDQSSIMRYFSRKDIRVVTACGCPTLDRKVVNSGKRLRAHVGIDEANVCGSCNLRGECERAYVQAHEDEGGRTVDVMRILLTHGLDCNSKIVENQSCQRKMVKESVRRLLKEIVEYGSKQSGSDSSLKDLTSSQGEGSIKGPMKQGDWICPKCNFHNFARNIRCLRCDHLVKERLQHLFVEQDHLPLRKGDWICETCNFLNFSKNTRCLRCREKPPKRHLNPGEWECESCNYINFRRNMICLKCDHRRPKGSNTSNSSSQFGRDNERKPKLQSSEAENGRKATSSWRFVEEEEEEDGDDRSGSSPGDYKVMDFPIVGGKSSLSRNGDRREIWRQEMSKRNEQPEEDDKNLAKTNAQTTAVQNLTDDEDMAEWFIHKNEMET